MERPLKKTVGDEFNWAISIEEMPHSAGFDYPVFTWVFSKKDDDSRGGTLRAWAPQGYFVFSVRGTVLTFGSLETVLQEIDRYGWGEPPHIDTVFQDVMETRKKMPAPSEEEALRIFGELRQKWQSLVV